MQILTIRKGIWSIRMQIQTSRKGFEAFESKFEPLKGIWGIRMQFQTIQRGFEAFESKFEPFERDLKHLNVNSNHSKGIWSIRIQIRFERDSKHLNANSNHSNQIRRIQMQILAIEKGF